MTATRRPGSARASALDENGLAIVEAVVGSHAPTLPAREVRATSHPPQSQYRRIVETLGVAGYDLSGLRISCAVSGGRRLSPQHDLAAAMALLAARLQRPVPWKPVFCAELNADGTLKPLTVPEIHQLLYGLQEERIPVFSRLFVMEEQSMSLTWRMAAQRGLGPAALLGFKALREAVGEFLLNRELPCGWTGNEE